MRIIDIIKTAQKNMLHARLRSSLTIIAVFIGALTISLTNGVGNGVKEYVGKQLGNLGAKDMMVVMAKQERSGPVSTKVKEYDPSQQRGDYNQILLTGTDLPKVQAIEGILEVIPQNSIQILYVTAGDKKYLASVAQYTDGLTVDMAAGATVPKDSLDDITIPLAYVEPLGFASAQDALGKSITLAYIDATGTQIEQTATIAGVQQSSLLGNSDFLASVPLVEAIHLKQVTGIPALADKYGAFMARFDAGYSQKQIDELKTRLSDAGYRAMTLADQLGTVNSVIDSILIALNLFGAIALLAASFGIVNTLLMAVKERTREIGLMKALGAHRRDIFAIFALEAVSIGFWGAVLGILSSMGIGSLANRYASHTFLKDFTGFNLLAFPVLPSLGIAVLIMAIAFVAGALPSIKASRLDPIEALRYE